MYHDAFSERGAAQADADAPAPSGLSRQISLREIWAPIYRSRYAILAIMAAVLSLAVTVTLLMEPIYEGHTTIEIKQEAQKVLGTEDDSEQVSSPFDAERFLETQLDIIRSRSTTQAVAESMGLYDNPQFLQAMEIPAEVEPSGILNAEEAKREAVHNALRANLYVSFSEDTRIANLIFSSTDPRLAADVANSYADNYIRLNLDRRFDASRYSLEFLREQLREAQARLGDSERRALAYARNSRLVDASNAAGAGGGGAPRSLTTATLVQINQSLSDASARRIAAEQKWAQVRSAPLLNIPEVLASPAIQQLIQQRAELRSQYEEQLARRTEDFPAVRQAAARLAEMDQQINRLGGNVRSSLREDFETAQAQEQALQSRLEALKTASLGEQDLGIRLSILQREVDTSRAQLSALLTRYNELNAQSGIQLNNLSIIDRAEAPVRAAWPNVPLNVALALVFGVILSGLFVLIRENLFDMVRTPDDVGARLGLPLLGAVPKADDVMVDLTDAKSAVSEAFSSIRTSLSLSSSAGVPSSLVFTSTQPGEGKTTTCFGLAIALAKVGRRVIVVDADLRRPNVHKVMNIPNTHGMSNVLAGGARAMDVTVKGIVPGIDVMAAGPIPPNPAELLASSNLASMLAELQELYDHVLIDSAPMLGLADAPIVASSGAKGIVYIVESGRTNVRGAAGAIGRLGAAGTPIAGVVLSRFDPGKLGYGYEYKYSYKYAYGTE